MLVWSSYQPLLPGCVKKVLTAVMCILQACLEEDEDRVAERTGKRAGHMLESQSLVLPGTLSSSEPAADDDAAADATYTVNEAIDHMGKWASAVFATQSLRIHYTTSSSVHALHTLSPRSCQLCVSIRRSNVCCLQALAGSSCCCSCTRGSHGLQMQWR